MSKILTGLLVALCGLMQFCGSPSKPEDAPENEQLTEAKTSKAEDYYPFIVYRDGSHMISAKIESKQVFDEFNPIFEKYGYSGNGYSWEDHITQILKKENPALLSHLKFDTEAGGFFMYADNEKNQRMFAELMSAIFKDKNKLEAYLMTAERTDVDD